MRIRYIGVGIGILLTICWWLVIQSFASHPILIGSLVIFQIGLGYYVGKKIEELQWLAFHDSLTDVFANKYFFNKMEEEIVQAKKYQYEVTLIVFDLDHFKKYNDTCGHVAGDQLLQDFARFLKKNIRRGDVIGRWGGEEFVIMLPQTNTEDGVEVASRIQQNFRHQFSGITASIGIASFPTHAQTAKELVTYADEAMYEAKKKRDSLHIAKSIANYTSSG